MREGRNSLVFKSQDLRYSCNNNRLKSLLTNQDQWECRAAKEGGEESVRKYNSLLRMQF